MFVKWKVISWKNGKGVDGNAWGRDGGYMSLLQALLSFTLEDCIVIFRLNVYWEENFAEMRKEENISKNSS